MDVKARLRANMTRLRKARGWSQEELADRAGLHRTYVSGIERMTRNPSLTILERLAVAFEETIGALTE
jgi:transcriptional regulator with XRE-family HTH domain